MLQNLRGGVWVWLVHRLVGSFEHGDSSVSKLIGNPVADLVSSRKNVAHVLRAYT